MLREFYHSLERVTWREFLRVIGMVILGAQAVGLAINITLTILVGV